MNYKFVLFRIPVMVLIVLSLGLFAVSAETIVSVDGVGVEKHGDRISAPIMINNVTDLGVAHIILRYNQSVVRVTSVTNSTFDFMTGVINNSTGTVRMVAMDYSVAGLSGDVKLADITLEAVGSTGETSSLNLIINELKEGGPPPEITIPAETDNGTFRITDPPEPPIIISSTTGCHWINWTWVTGSNSDLVEVNIDGVWKENRTNQYYNCSYPPHATRTISLRGYNSYLKMYSDDVGQTATIPNYAPAAIARSLHQYNNVGTTYPCKTSFNASASYDPDGGIPDYQWSFGDENSGTGALVEHIYSSCNWNGTGYDPFIVGLTVSDDLDSLITDTTTIPVNVYIAGDITGDGWVNIADTVPFGRQFGEHANVNSDGLCWHDNVAGDKADLNNDCWVNIADATFLGVNWGNIAW